MREKSPRSGTDTDAAPAPFFELEPPPKPGLRIQRGPGVLEEVVLAAPEEEGEEGRKRLSRPFAAASKTREGLQAGNSSGRARAEAEAAARRAGLAGEGGGRGPAGAVRVAAAAAAAGWERRVKAEAAVGAGSAAKSKGKQLSGVGGGVARLCQKA